MVNLGEVVSGWVVTPAWGSKLKMENLEEREDFEPRKARKKNASIIVEMCHAGAWRSERFGILLCELLILICSFL